MYNCYHHLMCILSLLFISFFCVCMVEDEVLLLQSFYSNTLCRLIPGKEVPVVIRGVMSLRIHSLVPSSIFEPQFSSNCVFFFFFSKQQFETPYDIGFWALSVHGWPTLCIFPEPELLLPSSSRYSFYIDTVTFANVKPTDKASHRSSYNKSFGLGLRTITATVLLV